MSVDACIREYENVGDQIFGHPRLLSIRGPIPFPRNKHSGKSIQEAIDKVVKRHTTVEQRGMYGGAYYDTPPGLCRV